MALHGQSAVNFRGNLKSYARSIKGHSAYNDVIEDMEACKTESGLHVVMSTWYSVCHSVDAFAEGKEPFPGTYNCRFCDLDLAEPHHAYEHTYACAKEAALEAAMEILNAESSPSSLCQFQLVRKKQFVPCGKVFATHEEKGEHMRSHVRTMTKKDDDGLKVISCFFGDCPVHPELGRVREGPDFIDEDDRLTHLWSVHHIAPNPELCRICDGWFIGAREVVASWSCHITTSYVAKGRLR